jgi:micrococcal nuclease
MNAPIKNNNDQTGNFRGLSIAVGVLVLLGCALLYTAKLPASQPTTPNAQIQQEQVPQVAGESTTVTTEEEYVPPEDTSEPTTAPTDTNQKSYTVTSVSDGDTIKVSVNGKIETIRLIGVDTPETKDPRKPIQCFGKQASDFTYKSLYNVSVRLDTDDSQQDRDKYGRLLRYVFLPDGTLFNQLLLSSGYAYEYTYKIPYQYQAQFKQAAVAAQTNQIGLWNPATCGGKK